MLLKVFYFVWLLIVIFIFTTAENPSVIIVGAGAAGIAAATTLLENSITNITIIEAKSRIGGRIHSVEFCGGIVEVGAQYYHGEKGNLVYELVKKLDLLEHSYLINPETAKLYTSNGNTVPSDLSLDLINTIWNFKDYINASSGDSLKEGFLETYNSSILQKYRHDEQKLKIVKDALPLFEGGVLMFKAAFSWDRIASRNHLVDSDSDEHLTWKNQGYSIILDILIKNYPNPSEKLPIDDKILLNKTVTKISWNATSAVVQISDKSSLTADHVIFTPSIGVLKEQMDTLFEPHLPKEKKNALEGLGLDGVIKIFLHFPTQWWKDEDYVFSFLWTKVDLVNSTNEFPDGPSKDGISWLVNIPIVMQIRNNYNVLLAVYVGDTVPEVEKLSEDVLLRGCNYLIQRFLGKEYNVSDADKVLRSQWYNDPNVRGTWSYEKAGYFKEDVSHNAKLGDPLVNEEGRPTLLFAGEATNPTHHSTVPGAIESGQREAKRIINLYKENDILN